MLIKEIKIDYDQSTKVLNIKINSDINTFLLLKPKHLNLITSHVENFSNEIQLFEYINSLKSLKIIDTV